VDNYIRSKGLGEVIQVIVYPDSRGEGYGIGRYEDHPRFDFSRVQQEPDVHFAHKSGFMCKTTATDPDRLRTLIAGGGRSTSPNGLIVTGRHGRFVTQF